MGKYKTSEELTKSGRYKRKKLEKKKLESKNTCILRPSQSSHELIGNSILEQNENELSSNAVSHSTVSLIPSNINTEKNDLRSDLASWCVNNDIPRIAASKLLKILRNHNIEGLPLDSRTLLKTPRTITIEELDPGMYIHIGLEKNLHHILKSYESVPDILLLDINIDGAPIFENSYEFGSLWPILCHINNLNSPVFAIGIYGGEYKPSDFNEFLKPFVNEFLHIAEDFVFNEKKILLEILHVILDAPARSSVCGIKGHNAYSACPKCNDVGIKKSNGRPALINTNAPLRNDTDFRNQTDFNHHNYHTIFEQIQNLDMINSFPIDYLHNVLLGIMRKLLDLWFGPKGLYPPSVKKRISSKIEELSGHEPKEFNRRLRSLDKMNKWKGTELRTFLLFIGPLALKDEISKEHYENFMLFSIAISILVDKKYCIQFNEIARKLITQFVETYEQIYGIINFTYNTHLLIHLPDDCLRNGPLDSFSSFKFESYLSKIKGFVRSPNNPVQQIHNRVIELFNSSSQDIITSYSSLNVDLQHSIDGSRYKNALVNNVQIIGNSEDDSFVLLKNKTVLKVNEFSLLNDSIMANGLIFNNISNFYSIPFPSKELDIFQVNLHDFSHGVINVSLFERKMFALPISSNQKLLCPLMPFLN